MTSSKSTVSAYAPANLPYKEEENPLSMHQLKSLGANLSSASACAWPTSNSTLTPMVSVCSSPATTAALLKDLPNQQRLRRRSLQDLPLPLRKRACRTPKERFAAFVAILLMYLNGGRNYKLSIQAKALVAECCQRNRMGDPHFSPLQESLSERLFALVQKAHWDRARTYLFVYLSRHHGFRLGTDDEDEDFGLLHYGPNNGSPVGAPRSREPDDHQT